MNHFHWNCLRFDELQALDLYEVLSFRERVFVVEQNCAFIDADGLDLEAEHMLVRDEGRPNKPLIAYARILAPGVKFPSHTLSRIAVDPKYRGTGLGREIVARAISWVEGMHGSVPIEISAQAHLQVFYATLGFVAVGNVYVDDGILHIDMKRD